MSLVVWLPMTKDLRQQGLSDVTVTNNGATFNSSGKLGGCYSFGTGDSYITIDSTPLKTFTEFSFACWVKIISWNTSYSTIFAAKNGTGVSWNNLIFSLLRNSSNSTLCFNISNGSNYTTTNCQTGTLSLDTWYHITCTYKSGEIKLYQDGDVVSTYKTTVIPNFNSIANLWIGKSNASSYQSNNLMNDVRIYDHCLSPMEVKRISQGLVLHYPLSDKNVEETTNLLPVNLQNLTVNGTSEAAFYEYITSNHGIYTLSLDVKREITDDNWVSPRISIFGYNGSAAFGYISDTNLPKDGKWHHHVLKLDVSDTSKTLVSIRGWMLDHSSGTTSKYISIRNAQLEFKNHETGYTENTRVPTIIYDTSGYCNNGTISGDLIISEDTPKYSASTKFSGSEKITTVSLPSEVQSVSFWVKVSTIPSGYGICYVDSGTQTSIGFYNGNSFITSCTVRANVVLLGTTFKANEWNHIVLVKTGTNTRNVYCNGVLLTSSGTNSWVHNGGNLSLGWRDYASGNAGWFNGQLCDFRAYATALSATDVKSLYQNTATIDADGTIHGAVR